MTHYTQEGLTGLELQHIQEIAPSNPVFPVQTVGPEQRLQYQIGEDAVSAAMQNQILIAAIEQAAVAIRHQGQRDSDTFSTHVDEWLQSLQQGQALDPSHVHPINGVDVHADEGNPHHIHNENAHQPYPPPQNVSYEPDHYRCTLKGVINQSAGDLKQNVRSVNCNAAMREAALNAHSQNPGHFDQRTGIAQNQVRIGYQNGPSAFLAPSDAVAHISVADSTELRRNRTRQGGGEQRLTKALHKTHVPTKSHKAVPSSITGTFTSMYRGVTRHRLTGRYEAHFWDSSYKRSTAASKSKRTKGRQIYLGGYDDEITAARTYDKAALAYLGPRAPTNFPLDEYADFLESIHDKTPEEVVANLRRGSVGFSRGRSQYRGVTKPHATKAGSNKWEARMGRIDGNKYLYLGTYSTPEAAAKAYDRAIVKYKGLKAVTNFDLSNYINILTDPDAYDVVEAAKAADASLPQKPDSAPSGIDGYVPLDRGAAQQGDNRLSNGVASHDRVEVGPKEPHAAIAQLPGGGAFHVVNAAAAATTSAAGDKFWEQWHLAMEVERQRQREYEIEAQQQERHPYHHNLEHQQYQHTNDQVPKIQNTVDSEQHQLQGGLSKAEYQKLQPAVELGAGGNYEFGQRNTTGAVTCTPSHRRALSPLAACLLSPLGLLPDGAPKWKSDSPLAKLLASDDMARLLESLQCADAGLVGTRLQQNPTHCAHQAHQAPGTAEDLWNALAWLESVDVTQLAPAPTH